MIIFILANTYSLYEQASAIRAGVQACNAARGIFAHMSDWE